MDYVFWVVLLSAFISSAMLTGLMREYALRKGLLDIPNTRSSHDKPVPRGGGVVFVALFVLIALVLYVLGYPDYLGNTSYLSALFIGGVFVGAIGFWDDHGHVNTLLRLAAHSLVVFLAIAYIGAPEIILATSLSITGWVSYLLVSVAIVWLLNLFNFMDGIDGIASVEAMCVAVGAAILIYSKSHNMVPVLWLLVLSFLVAGFLVWNWPPAKIFMGDVGSGYLGYMLGMFAVITSSSDDLSIWAWMVLLGVFIVDATVTLVRRIISGEDWYRAHRCHAYQNLSRQWKSHKKVVYALLVVNILWLFPLAWVTGVWPEYSTLILIVAYAPLIYITVVLDAGISRES